MAKSRKARSSERGYCLVSQDIREKIVSGSLVTPHRTLGVGKNGFFLDKELEDRVQPSSFDPVIGDEVYVLDTESQGIFTPENGKTVWRTLLGLPALQRQRASIHAGFEAKIGSTYLLPLEEKIMLQADEVVRSSPKSSIGRLFPRTRMVTDYQVGVDQIHGERRPDELLRSWLVLQPTAFNIVLWPGAPLTQLRYIVGQDASLSQSEIFAEHRKNPILLVRDENGSFVPAKPTVTNDGLEIDIDLEGRVTSGIVALRARPNPYPIDLNARGEYDAENYFEPITSKNGKIDLKSGDKYLMVSRGKLMIPAHLSAELRRHAGRGMRGTFDEAGFADPGFRGDLVGEVELDEAGGITLSAGQTMPMSTLEIFRSRRKPDKVYGGEGANSNYQGQEGLRVSKHFKPFDFARAAKEYQKLNRRVLVHDPRVLDKFRDSAEGFEPINVRDGESLVEEIEKNGFWHFRYDCENDPLVKQVIPYVVVFGNKRDVFTYIRADNIKDYGDPRLFGKYSIGVGGHVTSEDAPNYIDKCLRREVTEEELRIHGEYGSPRLVGTLFSSQKPVDQVHFGLVYTIHTDGKVSARESSITAAGMQPIGRLQEHASKFETWSRLLIPHLDLLYKK